MVHLKRLYFKTGTAKESCEAFKDRAKQLLKILFGKKYQEGTNHKWKTEPEGPKARFKKWKSAKAHTAVKEQDEDDDNEEKEEENNNWTCQHAKDHPQ